MNPVLVTGANGMFGSTVANLLRAQGRPVVAWTRLDADLRDPASLCELVRRTRSKTVIHCAAWTDVDGAETAPEECRTINVEASRELARGARETAATFVYISSGGIFDGRKRTPYDENDPPGPLSVYHRSKYDGEQAVRAHCPQTLIVRLGWMFGGGAGLRKNFVAARIQEAFGQAVIRSSTEQSGSPTWAEDAALRLVQLLERGATGVHHVANEGMASRFDYVSAILATAGSPTRVAPAPAGAFHRQAPVPANEALTSVRLGEVDLPPLRPWREALAAYLSKGIPAAMVRR
ncbi:MAG: dTDP-4-dehydrorhamnose reductase [Opitutales bacterium]